MILNSVLPLPGGPIPAYFFKATYIGRSVSGIRQDLGGEGAPFEQDLRNARLRVLRPTHLWCPSQWFVPLDDLNQLLARAADRPEVLQHPYGLIVPLRKTVVPLTGEEKLLLEALLEIQPLEQALDTLTRVLPGIKNPQRVLALMEQRGLIRYAFTAEVRYHGLRATPPAPDYTQLPLPHHQIGPPAMARFLVALTNRCPCRCRYCYYNAPTPAGPVHASESPRGPRTMSRARLRQAVDFILQTAEYKQHPEVLINWWGGDPAEEPELVRWGTEYAARRFAQAGRQVRFALDSGLITERARALIPLLMEYGFHLAISIDGPAELHNRNRPLEPNLRDALDLKSYESMDRARRELLRYADSGAERLNWILGKGIPWKSETPTLQIRHRCTLLPDDIHRYAELVDYFNTLDQPFEIALAAPADPATKSAFTAGIIQQLRRAQRDLLTAYCRQEPALAGGVFLNGHTNPVSGLAMLYTRCGFGGGNLLITPEGELYTCHRFADQPEFRVGTVEDEPAAVEQRCRPYLERWLMKFEPCASCPRQRYCSGGGCAHEAWLHYGTFSASAGCPPAELIQERARLVYLFNSLFNGSRLDEVDLLNIDSSHTRHLWFV